MFVSCILLLFLIIFLLLLEDITYSIYNKKFIYETNAPSCPHNVYHVPSRVPNTPLNLHSHFLRFHRLWPYHDFHYFILPPPPFFLPQALPSCP